MCELHLPGSQLCFTGKGKKHYIFKTGQGIIESVHHWIKYHQFVKIKKVTFIFFPRISSSGLYHLNANMFLLEGPFIHSRHMKKQTEAMLVTIIYRKQQIWVFLVCKNEIEFKLHRQFQFRMDTKIAMVVTVQSDANLNYQFMLQ